MADSNDLRQEEELRFYDSFQIEEHLPKGYRLRVHFADLEGPAEIVWNFLDQETIQFKESVRAKLFGLIPFWRHRWVTIGEVAPSRMGLTTLPIVVIYKKDEMHLPVISKALEKTEFRVMLEGSPSKS